MIYPFLTSYGRTGGLRDADKNPMLGQVEQAANCLLWFRQVDLMSGALFPNSLTDTFMSCLRVSRLDGEAGGGERVGEAPLSHSPITHD